jgi:hypothetical protein
LAGSHRAPRTPKPRARQGRTAAVPAWAIVVAIIAALIPATVLTAQRFLDSADPPTSKNTDLPIPPVSPKVSVQPSTAPSPTETAAHPPKLPRVAPAAPRRITARGLVDAGFDEAVTGIEPSSASEVARWESRGSPGSPGTDTVYVVGEVGAGTAFSDLPRLGAGAAVRITTDNGVLTYTVTASAQKNTGGLLSSPLFRTHKAGRLVLVGIRYGASGNPRGKAVVVTAQLSAATRS